MEIKSPEEIIKKLKSAYIAIDPPVSLKEQGFLAIKEKLPPREEATQSTSLIKIIWPRPALVPAIVTFLFLLMLISPAVLASLPGEIFYPARRLIEDISAAVYPNKTRSTDWRAEEVARLSEKGEAKESPVLEGTLKEYKTAVFEASREAQIRKESREELYRGLNRQKERFNRILQESKSPLREVREALETAEQALEVISAPPTVKEEKQGEKTPLPELKGENSPSAPNPPLPALPLP